MELDTQRRMKLKCGNCDSEEFITKPNRYDIYKLVDGRLVFQGSELIEERIRLFCRECSSEIEVE